MWREEMLSEARHQLVEAGVERDEFALTVGAVCGREPRYAVKRAGAPECERVRAALGQQGVEHVSHRNQTTCRRVDQPGVHPVSSSQEAVLGENLSARHHDEGSPSSSSLASDWISATRGVMSPTRD